MPDRDPDLTAAVLAGGGSRRFGSDKCDAVYRDRPLLWWALGYARRTAAAPFILTKRPLGETYGATVLYDHYPEPTPISGILTVAPFVKSRLLLLACDIILPDPGLLDLLLRPRDAEKATVFRIGGTLQPFLAVYPRALLPVWEDAFRRSEFHLRRIVESMPRIELDEKAIAAAGFAGMPVFNINTPEELRRAETLAPF
jgi:molybdopterin-guanine dinucleotide biosynthesis protein A